MEIDKAQRWLSAAALTTIGFGALIAAAALPALNGPMRLLTDLLVWPVDGAETLATRETRLLLAVSGGVMVGWGWLLRELARTWLVREPQAVRRLILNSAMTWFAVDSAASLAAGVPLNVVGNAGFLALFLWPLMRMRVAAA